MANKSIYTAFETMWQHVVAKVGTKSDINHNHDDLYYTENEVDTALSNKADMNHTHDVYETKTDSSTKYNEAKTYADNAANKVKNDLLNGAGDAYDTLKELGALIDENQDAIGALEAVATNKADKEHTHEEYETKEDSQSKYDELKSIKPDWSQNDETQLDYIKNRTHWVEESLTEFLPETEVSVTPSEYSNVASTPLDELYDVNPTFEDGTILTVTFDNVQYECPSYRMNGELKIGNALLTGMIEEGDPQFGQYISNAPFIIQQWYWSEGDDWGFGDSFNEWYEWDIAIQTNGEPETHTLKIEWDAGAIYHTLNEKFIPDTIARTSLVKNQIDTVGLNKMNISNPVGTGSFSMNRKAGTTVGNYSITLGNNCTASGYISHAEGSGTTASGYYSHAEGSSTEAIGYISHAEGSSTTASGQYSHAEGWSARAYGNVSHAEGDNTIASGENQHAQGKYNIEDTEGKYAHIVGNGDANDKRSNAHTLDWDGNAWYQGTIKVGGTSYDDASEILLKSDIENIGVGTGSHSIIFNDLESNVASGMYSHAEGYETTASGKHSHAEGSNTTASGEYAAHAEGYGTIAGNNYSHAEGFNTIALGEIQHTQGKYNIGDTENKYAHIVGNGDSEDNRSNAHTLDWSGNAWFAGDIYVGGTSQTDGAQKLVTIDHTHDGYMDTVDPTGTGSLSMNRKANTVVGVNSTTLGYDCEATAGYSHAEGYNTKASGSSSHAEGENTIANQDYSHVEGYCCEVDSNAEAPTPPSAHYANRAAHAEGYGSRAKGDRGAHAEGFYTFASGEASHSEGDGTTARGFASHAEGRDTIANGGRSHAEGYKATASGTNSHAEGYGTIATGENQHAQGKYNIEDTSNTYAHIVGNGVGASSRSNAHTLDWNGNAWYQGSVEATAIILKSPNGTRFNITIGNDGVLTASEIVNE